MITIDQLNREVEVLHEVERIVSLVPSISELICDLGFENKLVGCTKFCVHPNKLHKRVPIIGGTKKVDVAKVEALKPNIIFANKEENTKEDVQALESLFPIWISDVKNLIDAADMIVKIGGLLGDQSRAEDVAVQIQDSYFPLSLNGNRVIYLIWQGPMMSIGGDTFIHNVLETCGFENVLSGKERYPELSIDEIQELDPDLIFLSSEPFPFKDKHITQFQKDFPNAKTVLVDGEFFSWYGSRHLHVKQYLRMLGTSLS